MKLKPFGRVTRLMTITGAVGITALGLSSGSFANASTAKTRSAAVGNSLKPDFSYFVGKTITLDSPGSPGGSYDGLARLVAPALATFLHCTVNVVDYSNSIAGQDAAGTAAPNGLTIGELNVSGNLEAFVTHQPYLAFPIKTASFLAGLLQQEGDFVVSPSLHITSLQQLIAEPTAESVLDEANSSTDINLKTLLGVYGVKSNFVFGYANNAAILAGFIRGDGPVAYLGNATIEGAIAAGQAVPIAITDPLQTGMLGYARLKYDKVPTIAKLLQNDPPKTKSGVAALTELNKLASSPAEVIFAPSGTPPKIALALQDAIHSILNQPGEQKAEINEGFYTKYFNPTDVTKDIDSEIKNLPSLSVYLNG